MTLRLRTAIVVTMCTLAALPTVAAAHPAPFSYLDVQLTSSGLAGTLVVHDFDVAHDLGIEVPAALLDEATAQQQRGRLIALLERRLQFQADDQLAPIEWGALSVLADRQSLALAFRAPSAGSPATITVTALLFPYDPVHQSFINVYEDGALRHQAILDFNRRSLTYYSGTTQGVLAVVRTFVPAGIEHILIGPDHVLFLIGLLLLGGSVWKLTGIVTAFTIGHSITLSAAALDLVTLPARLIEPTIALSIVFVGVDNLLVHGARQTSPAAARDIRPWVAGVFGLVHGFGFASVLKEFGLPSGALGWSLFSFNLGVEIGQLAIVLLVASVLAAVRRRHQRLGDRLAWVGSIGVILAGGYWFIERVFLTGGAS